MKRTANVSQRVKNLATRAQEALEDASRVLSPPQRRRASAYLAGATKSEIARAEGVTPAAISKTLDSEKVVTYFRIATYVYRPERDLVPELLENLVKIATGAMHGISGSNGVVMVPDYRLRFDATLKILGMITSETKEKVQIATAHDKAAREGVHEETAATELIKVSDGSRTATRARTIRTIKKAINTRGGA